MTADGAHASCKCNARHAGLVAVGLLAIAVLGEMGARLVLGLGDPPLYVADPDIEYVHKPGVYTRFGNRLSFNQFSMRSGPIAPRKKSPNELRILVIGDSVVNGGSLLDDSELATTLLARNLHSKQSRPVYVANISAGSWGPTNQAAYLNKFGWFEADIAVLVESLHDARDASASEPVVGVSLAYPQEKPWSALWEGYQRYWPGVSFVRIFPALSRAHQSPLHRSDEAPARLREAQDAQRCRAALLDIGRAAKVARVPLLVTLFWERNRLDRADDADAALLLGTAAEMGAEVLDMRQPLLAAIESRRPVYLEGDPYHPSAEGHRLLAQEIAPRVLRIAHDPDQ